MDKYIKTEADRANIILLLQNKDLGFTVKILKGKRTNEMNKLQRLWLREAEQQGDMTAEEYRGYCKLHFGVPIMCSEDDHFREQYYKLMKYRYTYEEKLQMMMTPMDMPVTRLMDTKQNARYLDDMYQHFRGLGFELTEPKKG